MLTPAIESIGYGVTKYPSGLPKNTYYTPDGRVIKALPNMREYAIKRGNEIIEQGVRDANLDKGWLTQPPQVKKPFCQPCDGWHDTQEEVDRCRLQQEQMIRDKAQQVKEKQVDRTSELEAKVAQLTALVDKLLEVKDGAVL